ncbi:hypothetical protein [Dactylosporangium sp. CA-139066]|uniref:hypothetical protein n=1 Tax=Dactylosporangium sp. CA-139066 TaxID=3239930 RepID=UPI003D8C4A9F
MAGLYGADADELERFGQRLRESADRLEAIRGEVGSAFARAQWEGDDAQHFHDLWQHQLSGRLRAASTATRDAAGVVVRNARQQRDASAADGGGGGGGGAWGPHLGDPGAVTAWSVDLDKLEPWVERAGGLVTILGGMKALERFEPAFNVAEKRLGYVSAAVGGFKFGAALANHDTDGVKAGAVDLTADAVFAGLAVVSVGCPPLAIGVGLAEIGYSFVPAEAKVAAADAVIDAGKHVGHAATELGHAAADVGGAVGGMISGGFHGIQKALHR